MQNPEISDDDDVIDVIALEPDGEEIDHDIAGTPSRPIWPFALAGGVVLGFALSFGASWYVLKPASFDPEPMQADLAELRQQIATLEAKPDPVIPTVNLTPLRQRIAALEARPEVDPLNEDIVARLEALQAEGFEIPELPEMPDIAALESRLAALESSVSALEARPVVQAIPVASATQTVDPATLPRLPVKALRDGIAQLGGSGFLSRTLSRHVRVQGDDRPDRIVDLIVQDLEAGRAQAALAKFERLPPEVQSLARGWRADMEAALQ